MLKNYRVWVIGILVLFLSTSTFFALDAASYIKFAVMPKEELILNFSLINPQIKTISVDPSNKLALRIEVINKSGNPIPKAKVIFKVSKSLGKIYPSTVRTDDSGECIVTYMPPALSGNDFKSGSPTVTLSANVYGSSIHSDIAIKLVRAPIIFIHGYQCIGSIFDNMKDYLVTKGFDGNAMTYDTKKGIISGSKELNDFLCQQKILYLNKGIQVNKFDIISHSMGGLVTRYYTASQDYLKSSNVRKVLFISVPQKGSPWASLGTGYYDDQGMKDLIPDNPLLDKTFPVLINKGLNSTIQVGSIIGQYDEVVSIESASLDEWNIKTEVFNIGENKFTMDNLLSGKLIEAANHKTILNNKKVFEKIEEMLNNDLPYPIIKK